MENQGCTDWIELAKYILPAITVIIGWVVVNNFSITRERDKARREMIAESADRLGVVVDKIFEISKTYHSTNRNKKLEVNIKITLSDLSQRIASLSQISQDKAQLSNCLDSYLLLKQAITLNHFEDEHDAPLVTNELFELMASAYLALKRNLVELKHLQFPPPKVTCWLED